MRKHNGMRPQDVVILLKIIALGKTEWQFKDLAQTLFISNSEVSEAMNRSHFAGLIDSSRKKVNQQGLYEFLKYGLHYVFPCQPGAMVNGMATAHSHPFMKGIFDSETDYVWPDFQGEFRGLAIEPLYNGQTQAAKIDSKLYKLLAFVDVLRVGRVREQEVADNQLRKILLHES